MAYHIFVLIISLVVVIIFFKAFWWAMVAFVAIDIFDWLIYRKITKQKDGLLHARMEVWRNKLLFFIPELKDKH